MTSSFAAIGHSGRQIVVFYEWFFGFNISEQIRKSRNLAAIQFKIFNIFTNQTLYVYRSENPFFFVWDPVFVKGAFVTLGVGSVLAPSYLVYDFSFPSYAHFREGNPADAPKRLPPPTLEDT